LFEINKIFFSSNMQVNNVIKSFEATVLIKYYREKGLSHTVFSYFPLMVTFWSWFILNIKLASGRGAGISLTKNCITWDK
jgi:hypothetical protein